MHHHSTTDRNTMAACMAPRQQMPFPPMPTAGRRAAAAGGLHPLIAIRLRMQQGRHKYAAPGVGPGSIPRAIAVPSAMSADGRSSSSSSIGPSPSECESPQTTAHPRSLSPPPTPGRPRRHAKRSQVDVADFPEFLPAGKLSRTIGDRPQLAHSQLREKSSAALRPTTPFRPEPRFECGWVRQVDAEMTGNGPEDDGDEGGALPPMPFAPFRFAPEPAKLPPRMTEMTLKPATVPPPPPLPLSGGPSPAEGVARKMSGMNLSGSMNAAARAKFQKRAGRTNINARCA